LHTNRLWVSNEKQQIINALSAERRNSSKDAKKENTMEEVISTDEVAATEDQVGKDVQEDSVTVETPEETETQPDEIVIPAPKKQSAQERINELTRKRHEAEREAERLRQELAEKSKPPVQQTSGRPKIEDFETQEAYEDALYDWKDGLKTKEREAVEKRKAEEAAIERFNEKAKKLKETYEDFDEIVEQPVFSPVMREVLLNSDEGAMVSYFLGRPENHGIAEKIRSLSPQSQIYELGKLETKLILAQKTKTSTSAPSPIKPVGMTGGAVVDESKMSDAEWVAMDRKREAERRTKPKYGG